MTGESKTLAVEQEIMLGRDAFAWASKEAHTMFMGDGDVAHSAEILIFAMGMPFSVAVDFTWESLTSWEWEEVRLRAGCPRCCSHRPVHLWANTESCGCPPTMHLAASMDAVEGEIRPWLEDAMGGFRVGHDALASALAAGVVADVTVQYLKKVRILTNSNPLESDWPAKWSRLSRLIVASNNYPRVNEVWRSCVAAGGNA